MRKCSPQEIIKKVPNVQTVILPENWFDNLSDKQDVFSSLYEWMLEKGRVPSEYKETIHNRTYVGEKLHNRLLAAEKKRLSKKLKIKGDDLERSLSWSDASSGPITEISYYKISGETILVIPESSKQAFDEFSINFHRKERETIIKKIKATAAGATFYQWLLSQIERPDNVGDVARDAEIRVEEFPRESNQYEEIKCFYGGYTPGIESLKEGWLEYLQQYPERVQPYAWCSECSKKIDIQDALLAWSSKSRELFILDIACLNKYKRFDKMISRCLSGVTHVDLEELVEKDAVSELDIEDMVETLRLWGILPIVIEGCVYFLRSEKTHAIKIGFTAGPVEKRLGSLQTAHPYKLQLLATTPGTAEYEKSLHERFASFRLKGEWFEPHPDLLAFITVLSNR